LLLNDCGAVPNRAASADVVNLQPHQITTSQLAIDGEIEQGEVALTVLQLVLVKFPHAS
jgi:hypothetical protein